ncbi:MAG: hypothetical protein ABW056_01855 [Thermoanaerobaculia bacterium]
MRLRVAPAALGGAAAIVGGALGVLVGPVMVIVKYLTGWAIVPEPAWISAAKPALGSILSFATPVGLWVFYGRIYTVALLLMLAGIAALALQIRARTGRVRPLGLWVLIAGLCLVIPGDAVHTATWHQNGLTVPTPGTNPLANTAYAIHMMGMNFVLVGAAMTGISALRKGTLAPWLAWLLLLVTPIAVGLSLTFLPTTPGGALWMFSFLMIAVGCSLVFGRPRWQKEPA